MRKLFSTYFLHRVSMVILPFLLIISFSSALPGNVEKKICQTKECLSAAQNLKKSMNFDVNPCDDFYEYACGNWSKSSTPGSAILSRYKVNAEEILDFIKQNNTKDEPEAVHKARQFFSSCMNQTQAAYSNASEQVKILLDSIGIPRDSLLKAKNTDIFDYTTALAKAIKLAGVKVYFELGVVANPFNRTLNTIALTTETSDFNIFPSLKRSRSILRIMDEQLLQDYMNKITEEICENDTISTCKEELSSFNFSKNIISEKTAKQKLGISETTETSKNAFNGSNIPVKYTLKQLQDLTDDIAAEVNTTMPTLNWTKYIEEMFTGLDNVTLDLSDPNKVQIIIAELDSLKDTIQALHKINKPRLIMLQILSAVLEKLQIYTDSRFQSEDICAALTELEFGMAVSYVYATKEKYIKIKAEIPAMIDHIRQSFHQIIQHASWMDAKTRQRALEKLESLKSYAAYPSTLKTTSILNDFYKDVQITDNLYNTIILKTQSEITNDLEKLNQINDLSEHDWSITPNIVNAYYDPSENSVFILAGILGHPFFYDSLHALDYGAIGSVVGHELAHGFDNTGRRFNEIGNIEDWWQPETANLYRDKAKCFVRVYGNYNTTSRNITQMGDSKLTLGEDLSDNVGFKESLLAYQKCVSVSGKEHFLPQFEEFSHEQLLTLAFANVWCENPSKSSALLSKLEVHSPNGVRVNGVLRNSKEFSEIWKCPKGSNMNPSDDKCAVW